MNLDEAYDLIESCLDYDKDMSDYPERYELALQIAKELFQKQTPMKYSDEKELLIIDQKQVTIQHSIVNFLREFEYDCSIHDYHYGVLYVKNRRHIKIYSDLFTQKIKDIQL